MQTVKIDIPEVTIQVIADPWLGLREMVRWTSTTELPTFLTPQWRHGVDSLRPSSDKPEAIRHEFKKRHTGPLTW